jgi:uncharacterized protein YukE
MLGDFLQGDPTVMAHFASTTGANGQDMTAATTGQTNHMTGVLPAGFQGHAANTCQSVYAGWADAQNKLEALVAQHGQNLLTASKTYDATNLGVAQCMSNPGPLGDVINPPAASA